MYVVLIYEPNPLASQHAQEPESYVTCTFGPFDTAKEASEWSLSAIPNQERQIMKLSAPC